jgi:hypothetical protein
VLLRVYPARPKCLLNTIRRNIRVPRPISIHSPIVQTGRKTTNPVFSNGFSPAKKAISQGINF